MNVRRTGWKTGFYEKKLKGNFTVEATLVLPLLLIYISTMINLTFYLHDRSVLASAAYETALKGTQINNQSDREIENYLQETGLKIVGARLLAYKKYNIQTDVNHDNITIIFSGKTEFMGGLPIAVKKEVKRIYPLNFIRDYRKINSM